MLHEAADACDFCHALHAGELIAHEPILRRTQFAEIITAAGCFGRINLQIVLIDPAETAGVRAKLWLHALGHVGLKIIQPLQHACPREVSVHALLEDDCDERETEHRGRAHVLDARKPLQTGRKRERHLILDLLRAAAHPIGIDKHLIFREVGNGVHRRLEHRPHAKCDEHQRAAKHEEAVLQTPPDDAGNHGFTSEPQSSISLPNQGL